MANNFLEISRKILSIIDQYSSYTLPNPITSLSSSDIDAFASSALGYELKLYIDQVKQKGNLENIGIAGPVGDPGPKGPQGDVGDMGPQGPVGDKGPRGRDGKDGQDGKPGADGQNGSSGGSGGSLPSVISIGGGSKFSVTKTTTNIDFNKWYTMFTSGVPKFAIMQLHLSGANYNNHLDTNVVINLSSTGVNYFCGQMGRNSYSRVPSWTMELHSMVIF